MKTMLVPRLCTLKPGSEFEIPYSNEDGDSVVRAHDAVRRIKWRWKDAKLEIIQATTATGGAYMVKVLENSQYRERFYTVKRKLAKTKAEPSARLLPHENGAAKFWASVYHAAYVEAMEAMRTSTYAAKPHEHAAHEADAAHREYVKRFGA